MSVDRYVESFVFFYRLPDSEVTRMTFRNQIIIS
jgi:hypothetical protein